MHAPEDLEHAPLVQRYELLQDYFTPFPVRAASLRDICTDKMIALPISVLTRNNPRYRDIWDLEWITRRLNDVEALASQVSQKAAARGLGEQYAEALAATIKKSRGLIESTGFLDTLQRFIPKSLAMRTVADTDYRKHLITTVEFLCTTTLRVLRRQAGQSHVAPTSKHDKR